MEDVHDGSYLRAGGIWAALQSRGRIARLAAIKDSLYRHATRSIYEQSRAELLQLINRKLYRKDYLIKEFNKQFTDALHKQITNVDAEITTLLGMVKAFDAMADFQADETAKFVDEWYTISRKNLVLNQILDSYREMYSTYSNLALDLHDYCLKLKHNPANA